MKKHKMKRLERPRQSWLELLCITALILGALAAAGTARADTSQCIPDVISGVCERATQDVTTPSTQPSRVAASADPAGCDQLAGVCRAPSTVAMAHAEPPRERIRARRAAKREARATETEASGTKMCDPFAGVCWTVDPSEK